MESLDLWRKNVFTRDNKTCQKCKSEEKLNAHHIYNSTQYPKSRYLVANSITLCYKCHKLFHPIYGNQNNNKEQLKEFLNLKNYKKLSIDLADIKSCDKIQAIKVARSRFIRRFNNQYPLLLNNILLIET